MEAESTKVIKIFYCYARKDKTLRDELEKHLGALKRSGQITTWFDREILPGKEWAQEIDTRLNTADLVLLLVSPDFIHSDYCYSKEMLRALERREAGETHVIPIILRPVDCEGTPICKLQMLPTDGKPVTKWKTRDDAFRDISGEIRKVIATLQKTVTQWVIEGNDHFSAKSYQEALTAYEHAIRLRPNEAMLYGNKSLILRYLKRYEEALAAAEYAISLDPNSALADHNKGWALRLLRRYQEAQEAFSKAEELGYDRR